MTVAIICYLVLTIPLLQNSFQIKIVVYRNYNSNESEILQLSSWENKAQNLINFLKTVHPNGGWGNEAIEMGLWYANQEADLSQVILIGDGNFYIFLY